MAIDAFPKPITGSGNLAGRNKPLLRVATVTSTGTWTHPDGASASDPKEIYVIAIGGGGGGGGGRAARQTSNDSSAVRLLAGGGGGGAGYVSATRNVITAPASVTIGSGGTGGAGQVNNAGGANGGNGGTTSFGTSVQVTFPVKAFGANGGSLSALTYTSTGTATYQSTVPGGLGSSTGGDGTQLYNPACLAKLGGMENGRTPFEFGGASGAGGAGLSRLVTSATTPVVDSQAHPALVSAIGTGGAGGTAALLTASSGNITGGAGGNATGNGCGGGGGGAGCLSNSSTTGTATGGAGGSGSNGIVIIFY